MALRIATRLPRLAVVGAVLLLASATLAVGAAKRMAAVPKGAPAPVTVATVVVPDVTGQAFVFAKGTLEDTGLAWKVVGAVHGYAANKVLKQMPAAGTKLKDTGAPTITVTLERTAYPEKGEPEDVSPYFGTSVVPVGLPKATPAPAAAAAAARASPRRLHRGPCEDERERPVLPLSAQLDRHRREVRLVARSGSAPRADRRRPSRPAALGHRTEKRARRTRSARGGRSEELLIERVRR